MPRKPTLDEARRAQQRWTGARIRQAREAAGFTQDELSQMCGFSRGVWISEIERGLHSIDAQELRRIAQLTRYPIEWFLDPEYDQKAILPPQSVPEWERLYPDQPQLARAHANLDTILEPPKRERRLGARRNSGLTNLASSLTDGFIGRNHPPLALSRR